MASTVKFFGVTFPSNWSNAVVEGQQRPRVKQIFYPGTDGGYSLKMGTGEKNFVHTGTIRVATQGSVVTAIDAINSICDGTRTATAGDNLQFHGRSITSVYSTGVQWGTQRAARGNGGISTATSSYFAVPFTITYIKINP